MNAPIGVFDSGIGGLTVVRAMRAHLPTESLLYVGDTARVPYGPKSPDTVRHYAEQIAHWLVAEGVKAIVVACNTATAHALDTLQDSLSVPVIGVITPGANAAVATSTGGHIGVIGTAGTIASGAYERAIHRIAPDATVHSTACPLFVPLAEEGFHDHPATALVAREYLAAFAHIPIDTLVLGCTHYPLLASVIQEAIGPDVLLIDSSAETAMATGNVLAVHGIEADAHAIPSYRFVVSDAPARFLSLGRRFLGGAMDHVEHITFE